MKTIEPPGVTQRGGAGKYIRGESETQGRKFFSSSSYSFPFVISSGRLFELEKNESSVRKARHSEFLLYFPSHLPSDIENYVTREEYRGRARENKGDTRRIVPQIRGEIAFCGCIDSNFEYVSTFFSILMIPRYLECHKCKAITC